MKAYVFSDGRIKFGSSVPPGAIKMCSGRAKTVHDVVTALAIQCRDSNAWLVPGVRGALSRGEVIASLTAFAVACTQRIEQKKAKGARRGS